MALKKEIKPWLKEVNMTWEQMDAIWDELLGLNKKCKMLNDAGKRWNDLTMPLIKGIPELKVKTLEQQAEKRLAEEKQAQHEREVKEYEKYFNGHFDEIMVQRIDNNEEIEEQYLKRLAYNGDIVKEGENRRWSRTLQSVVRLCGRYFMIEYEEGLTESQPDQFNNQPVEVIQRTGIEMRKTTYWEGLTASGLCNTPATGMSKKEIMKSMEKWLDGHYTTNIEFVKNA